MPSSMAARAGADGRVQLSLTWEEGTIEARITDPGQLPARSRRLTRWNCPMIRSPKAAGARS